MSTAAAIDRAQLGELITRSRCSFSELDGRTGRIRARRMTAGTYSASIAAATSSAAASGIAGRGVFEHEQPCAGDLTR